MYRAEHPLQVSNVTSLSQRYEQDREALNTCQRKHQQIEPEHEVDKERGQQRPQQREDRQRSDVDFEPKLRPGTEGPEKETKDLEHRSRVNRRSSGGFKPHLVF